MAVSAEPSRSQLVQQDRAKYVARGVSTPALVVGRASGAHVEDVDGNRYLDFAGGIGCLNFGHGLPTAVRAIHAQADAYLHQCFMVATYEPYVAVCRRLAELSPCSGAEQRSVLLNSGAEAVENAVKIARVATGRQAVLVFDRGFHGRTMQTMAMTSKVLYKKGFGPFPPEVYRTSAPYEYRGISVDQALSDLAETFRANVDPESVACAVLEPVQGEGGFLPMPEDFLRGMQELLTHHGILWVDDEVQSGMGRTGRVWAVDHFNLEPDLLVSGKSLGGGLPLAAVTGGSTIMDAPHPGGLGGTFGGNPLSCAAALAALDTVAGEDLQRRALEVGERLRAGLDSMARRVRQIGDVRGLGPMLAMELVEDKRSKAPAGMLAAATSAAGRRHGILLLTCGMHGNVIRLLPPLTISDDEIDEGLTKLEASLRDAVEANT